MLGGEIEECEKRIDVFSNVVTAFGYFGPYSVANRVIASRAWARVSAYITSCNAAFARGWRRRGNVSRMLASL